MPKHLLISASPRKGNADFILKTLSNKLESNEIIYLRDKKIQHCKGCLTCHNTPNCIIQDDMKNLIQKLINSEILIIATPNYFDNVSGLLKDFIDRTHPCYKSESLKNKKVILIMVGGGDIEGSKEYLEKTTYGFIKYLKLNLVSSHCFKALNNTDLENNQEEKNKIKKILIELNQT